MRDNRRLRFLLSGSLSVLPGILAGLAGLGSPQTASAYSVLTHEAIVDSAWEDVLRPLIKAAYPDATGEQLLEAHGYAYGGAIIQDLGYYPFGSKLFSDLVHYVRSGDFPAALIREAKDVNEYAFALGALCHYAADNNGHPTAVNRAVSMLYPKIARKYGPAATYEDDPGAHLKAEFGFDVLEVARGNYAPKAYHDFIGFKVSKPVLERAFEDTYGVPFKSMFASVDLALGTYRRTVSGLIPEMTKAAWDAKKEDIGKSAPGSTRRKFVYNLSRASYEKEWGHDYERPGVGARILAFLFRILPRVGPFKAFAFRMPTPAAERLFMQSFNDTLTMIGKLAGDVRSGHLDLPPRNLDTGQPVREGDYRKADAAYGKLLEKLADRKDPVPEELRKSILTFYRKPPGKLTDKALRELEALRQAG